MHLRMHGAAAHTTGHEVLGRRVNMASVCAALRIPMADILRVPWVICPEPHRLRETSCMHSVFVICVLYNWSSQPEEFILKIWMISAVRIGFKVCGSWLTPCEVV